jgi:serine/threonine-protein kinase
VDQICDRFEDAWVAGQRPRMEGFLAEAAEAERPLLLGELLRLEWHYRRQTGDSFAEEEYLQRFPEDAELIRAGFRQEAVLACPAAAQLPADPEPGREPDKLAPDLPTIPGYEILGVLGRGAMGVVYKAWHQNLKRAVALKMILAGGHAGPEERARFRQEAEAVARLQHANIVQIFDVGEHQGLPYFSLELVEGGNLAQKLSGALPPPEEAAQLLGTLARAMHAAHRQQIVHRDLKPANVLLTAEGTPKITDFGLAKCLDRATVRTQSGAILGTPSYMAPEQVGSKTGDISPVTDLYALGAILYELLTGRPPFQAGNVEETLWQVKFREPVRPRKLNRAVDRGLEAICLKCLEKKPQHRYGSAKELADDLERWERGECPRPLRWPARVQWFVGRHAAALVLAVVAGLVAIVVLAARRYQSPDAWLQRAWHRLENGEAVEVLGTAGQPPWQELSTEHAEVQVSKAPDGAFSLQAHQIGLLTILPDPRVQCYSFSVEIRHDLIGKDGEVGVFCAQSKHPIAQGKVAYYFCALVFNDLDDLPTRYPKLRLEGNPAELTVQRYLETVQRYLEPEQPGPRYKIAPFSRPFKAAAPVEGPGDWREVTLKVSPQRIQAFWGDQSIGALTRTRWEDQVAIMARFPPDPIDVHPDFDPRGALGLFVYRGSASFRNIVVQPLSGEP